MLNTIVTNLYGTFSLFVKDIISTDIVHLKLVSHISPCVDISVSKTVQMISVQRGWGPREMVWCQNETNLDVVG